MSLFRKQLTYKHDTRVNAPSKYGRAAHWRRSRKPVKRVGGIERAQRRGLTLLLVLPTEPLPKFEPELA